LQGFIGFLLLIDGATWRLWAKSIKNKSGPTIQKVLGTIFDSINGPITELSSDAGSEFIYNRQFFKDRNILFRIKYGKGKFLIHRPSNELLGTNTNYFDKYFFWQI